MATQTTKFKMGDLVSKKAEKSHLNQLKKQQKGLTTTKKEWGFLSMNQKAKKTSVEGFIRYFWSFNYEVKVELKNFKTF